MEQTVKIEVAGDGAKEVRLVQVRGLEEKPLNNIEVEGDIYAPASYFKANVGEKERAGDGAYVLCERIGARV